MGKHAGVWIDHERAILVEAGHDTVTVVPSDVPGHPRFTGGGGYPGGQSSQRGASEHRSEERNRNALDRYFDRVIATLGPAEALLIMGPGEAKHQFADRVGQGTARPQPALAIEAADKLSDAQIVAKVTKYFATRPDQ